MTEYKIEPLNECHAEGVVEVFNHYVENSFAAYLDSPVPAQFFGKLMEMAKGFPALAVRAPNGEVAGFAFLHAYHPAPSFNRTAEITYFIGPKHVRKGLGSLMLSALVDEAKKQEYDNILASVSSLNPASLSFHAKNGFEECGRLRAVGRKFGRDFDVVYMQRKIG